MTSGDAYRTKATELRAIAQREPVTLQAQFEALAQSYLRLAEQAERNARLDVSYETPSPKLDPPLPE
jgi:hypothetical protein